MSVLQGLLSEYRAKSQSEREKGDYFERLALIFLKHDPLYAPQFRDVWFFSDWARKHGLAEQDLGIDLVAKNANDDMFTAIQCKFYSDDNPITRGDIDSFVSDSTSRPEYFNRLILIDTSRKGLNTHAKELLGRFDNYTRISIDELEASPIKWETFRSGGKVEFKKKRQLWEHQQEAIKAVCKGLKKADRGKLIMACGTGKTFTSLKIAEDIAGKGKLVLYLVPSLALMTQTIREWANDSDLKLNAYATCSDVMVGRRRNANSDSLDVDKHDLALEATTDAEALARKFVLDNDKMNVIYTTYHSIDVISKAQKEFGLPEVDLIVCDEAHRTTGVEIEDKEESHFIKIHKNEHVKGKKRLYMTATPKIYSDKVKDKADEVDEADLISMDDENLYGEILHFVSFGYAVSKNLLCDYKVIILAIDEEIVSAAMQNRLKDEDNTLNLDDVSKIIGCYKALNKKHTGQRELKHDSKPIRSAVAFSSTIKSSKNFCSEFSDIIDDYNSLFRLEEVSKLKCRLDHVDGGHNANERSNKLSWLASSPDEDVCHILSNAKCLSEGVDVPSLDAVIFMQPRKSPIDVVQAVGRVMRKIEGKQLGYVILPVAISPDVDPEKALRDSKYKVIWQILNALRSHDENLDARINQAGLGEDISDKIEVYVVSDNFPDSAEGEKPDSEGKPLKEVEESLNEFSKQGHFTFDDVHKAIMDKIVEKCGTRTYWTNWANDIKKIAENYMLHIKTVLEEKNSPTRKAFNKFLQDVHDDLNDEVSEDDAIEMLAQHLITKPIFDDLFEGGGFTDKNPVSKSMDSILAELGQYNLKMEAKSLNKFYRDVKNQIKDLKTPKAKQNLIIALYNNFFSYAFDSVSKKLGIVYTPIEVVDFIIHSVNDVLQSEFSKTLGSEGVHILDPFTGTGSFIVQLIESGLLTKEQLIKKYSSKLRFDGKPKMPEIHANEIVLLAYYISCINIENAYHAKTGEEYKPFEGICLTDTFALTETDKEYDLIEHTFIDNSHRRMVQKSLNAIQVIIGNPPYSVAKGNIEYKKLNDDIKKSYARLSKAQLKSNLYDSYIRSIRWASDRIKDKGVIGFVTGSGFIQKPAMDGMRKCLHDEFSSLYIINLRGDIKKKAISGGDAQEGDNIFGQGSQSGIAISILVKNPEAKEMGKIYYHDIGDNLSTQDKKDYLKSYQSISGMQRNNLWRNITPDKFNDWINQRDDSFNEFIAIGDKNNKNITAALFNNFSLGIATNRDAWCYNTSKEKLAKNMRSMINFYNSEVERYKNHEGINNAENFVCKDFTKISWTGNLIKYLEQNKEFEFQENSITESIYRPFSKTWYYSSPNFNERLYQMPKIFPLGVNSNKVICLTGLGSRSGFHVLMVDKTPDLGFMEATQCFPLTLYEKVDISDTANEQGNLSVTSTGKYGEKHGVSNVGLQHFQNFYDDEKIEKDDIFYYVYGLLHSQEYRDRFKNNLSKQLPRIPCVKEIKDFWSFVEAGRKLADLHLNYETQEPYHVDFNYMIDLLDDDKFYVDKMKHSKNDKTSIIYNRSITLSGIPEEAYEYKINGKSVIELVMAMQRSNLNDRAAGKKESGIINDANDYAIETLGNPRYPLELLLSIITVSLETMKIVKSLPKLDI